MVATEAIIVTNRERVEVTLGDINRLAFTVQEFGKYVDEGLLEELGIIPKTEGVQDNPVLFMSLYDQFHVHVEYDERETFFDAQIPIDVKKIARSATKPIALVHRLDWEKLLNETDRFINGKSSDLSAAGLTYVLSDRDNPTTVLVNNPPKEKYRTVIITNNKYAKDYIKYILALKRKNQLGESIRLPDGGIDQQRVFLLMDNDSWTHGRVFKHKRDDDFIDPEVNINVPLFVGGRCFILQIGLRQPPFNISEEEFYTKLDALRVFAQRVVEKAWTEAGEALDKLQLLDRTKVLLDVHEFNHGLTSIQGYVELIRNLIRNGEVTDETIPLLGRFAETALNWVKLEKERILKMFENASDPEVINFQNLFTEAQTKLDRWMDSEPGKEALKGKEVEVSYDVNITNHNISVICKPWMLGRLFRGALENSLKHATKVESFNFSISAQEISEDRQRMIEIVIADDLGGAREEETLNKLNTPNIQKVDSDTDTLGRFLPLLAQEFRSLGKMYGIKNPILFSNTNVAGSRGFTITVRLPVADKVVTVN